MMNLDSVGLDLIARYFDSEIAWVWPYLGAHSAVHHAVESAY